MGWVRFDKLNKEYKHIERMNLNSLALRSSRGSWWQQFAVFAFEAIYQEPQGAPGKGGAKGEKKGSPKEEKSGFSVLVDSVKNDQGEERLLRPWAIGCKDGHSDPTSTQWPLKPSSCKPPMTPKFAVHFT